MTGLYEESDLINQPFQCFYYNSERSPFPIAPHWHFYMEVILLLHGHLRITVENTEYNLSEGEIILIHPKVVHAFYAVDKNRILMAGIKFDLKNLSFSSHYVPTLNAVYQTAAKRGLSILFPKEYVQEFHLDDIFHRSVYEQRHREYEFKTVILSELHHLLILLARFWQRNDFVIDNTVVSVEDNDDIFNILPYISAHLDSELKVSDIADYCGLSYSYFAKRFQEIYGKSCKKYIEDMRVYRVEELLLFTDLDLTDISLQTGFSDCSHLIRSFKERRGLTPRQYRLQNKNRTEDDEEE